MVGQLIDPDDYTADYEGKTFEPTIGEPDATNPLVRIVAVNDMATAAYRFAQLVDAQVDENTASYEYKNDAVGTLNYTKTNGGSHDGPLWGNEDARESFGTERIKEIMTKMNASNRYRRMMLAVEACYSGQWGEALIGLPDLLVLTAANSMETSKADVFDQQLGIYLSNAFSRTFRSMVFSQSDLSIYALYRELYKTTTGSHVTIYNNQQYGSVYTETMNDYFPPENSK